MIWTQKKIVINIYFANRYFDLDYKNYVMLRLLKFQNIMLVYFYSSNALIQHRILVVFDMKKLR